MGAEAAEEQAVGDELEGGQCVEGGREGVAGPLEQEQLCVELRLVCGLQQLLRAPLALAQ